MRSLLSDVIVSTYCEGFFLGSSLSLRSRQTSPHVSQPRAAAGISVQCSALWHPLSLRPYRGGLAYMLASSPPKAGGGFPAVPSGTLPYKFQPLRQPANSNSASLIQTDCCALLGLQLPAPGCRNHPRDAHRSAWDGVRWQLAE